VERQQNGLLGKPCFISIIFGQFFLFSFFLLIFVALRAAKNSLAIFFFGHVLPPEAIFLAHGGGTNPWSLIFFSAQ